MTFRHLSCLAVLLVSALGPSAGAVTYLKAELRNPEVAARFFGNDTMFVWLSNLGDGRVVSRAKVEGGAFTLAIPEKPANVKYRRYEVCDGVRVRAKAPVLTYTPETMMLYNRATDRAIGPIIQADDPRTPTRTVQYLYSTAPASIVGRCTYLNQEYRLKLRRGWNVVLHVQGQGRERYTVTNATQALPFWVQGDLKFEKVSRVLPPSFFRDF